jgi:hypothetical protein
MVASQILNPGASWVSAQTNDNGSVVSAQLVPCPASLCLENGVCSANRKPWAENALVCFVHHQSTKGLASQIVRWCATCSAASAWTDSPNGDQIISLSCDWLTLFVCCFLFLAGAARALPAARATAAWSC